MVCALSGHEGRGDAISLYRWLHYSSFDEALEAVGMDEDSRDPIMHYFNNGEEEYGDDEFETAVLLKHVISCGLLCKPCLDDAMGEEDLLRGLKKVLDMGCTDCVH